MSAISQSSGAIAGILVTTECALRAQIYLLYDKLMNAFITGTAELPSCCEGNVLGADHTCDHGAHRELPPMYVRCQSACDGARFVRQL